MKILQKLSLNYHQISSNTHLIYSVGNLVLILLVASRCLPSAILCLVVYVF